MIPWFWTHAFNQDILPAPLDPEVLTQECFTLSYVFIANLYIILLLFHCFLYINEKLLYANMLSCNISSTLITASVFQLLPLLLYALDTKPVTQNLDSCICETPQMNFLRKTVVCVFLVVIEPQKAFVLVIYHCTFSH